MSKKSENQDVKCVAVVQCHIAHERCAGTSCAIAFAKRDHHFAGYGEEAVFYVPFTCGGCPGRRVSRLAVQLQKPMKNLEIGPENIVVHLAACVVNDNWHYLPCPHVDYMKAMIERKGLLVVEGSVVSSLSEKRRKDGVYQR
jgi:predicted metal-binding protein